jgi:uncharacterized protein (TIGR02145 family)
MKKPIFNTAVAVAVAVAAVFCIGCGGGGGSKPASLKGQWVDVNPKPEDSEEFELLSDGTAMFKNGDLTVSGTWNVVDKRFIVTVNMEGTSVSEAYNYKLSGYELTLVNDKGDTSTCVKKEKWGEFKEKRIAAATSTFKDSRDGKSYKVVKIGGQSWFAENLNYAAEGSKCYENSDDNCAKYGRLYDWATAMKACPAGTHLPTDKEWTTLVDYAGGEEKAGKKLKSTAGWKEDGNGTNDYGFLALPGGDGAGVNDDRFGNAGEAGFWWSATESINNYVGRWQVDRYSGKVYGGHSYNAALLSVRCLQD